MRRNSSRGLPPHDSRGPIRLRRRAAPPFVPVAHGADPRRAVGLSAGGSTARSACRTPGSGCRRPATSPTSSSRRRPRRQRPTRRYVNDLPFLDSDLYKWLEAIGWTLADPELAEATAAELRERLSAAVDLLRRVQAADGYLDSHFQVRFPGERFVQLPWGHELYCAGHLIQAAVAVHRAPATTRAARGRPPVRRPHRDVVRHRRRPGRRRLRPSRDRDRAGRAAPGDRRVALPGRGAVLHRPPRPRPARRGPVRPAVLPRSRPGPGRPGGGRSLRAPALPARRRGRPGAETGEPALREAAERLWAAGHRHPDLPDRRHRRPPHATRRTATRTSCRTSAATARPVRPSPRSCSRWRMLLLTGEAKYADLLERTLYNGFLAGISLDGERYIYANPLQVRDDHVGAGNDQDYARVPWFACACCPPNVMRLLASLEHYVALSGPTELRLHQYVSGTYAAELAAGRVGVEVSTDYPWRGRRELTVTETARTGVDADGPGAALGRRRHRRGQRRARGRRRRGRLVAVTRRWRVGDRLTLTLPVAAPADRRGSTGRRRPRLRGDRARPAGLLRRVRRPPRAAAGRRGAGRRRLPLATDAHCRWPARARSSRCGRRARRPAPR